MSPRLLFGGIVVCVASLGGCAATKDPVAPALGQPLSCASEASEPGHEGALAALYRAGIQPLCASTRPLPPDFSIRITSFYFSASGTYRYEAKANRLRVFVDDGTYDPAFELQHESRVRTSAFLRALEDAGLREVWRADDPDCFPGFTAISELGSIIELHDSSGYFVRPGPRAQAGDCATPYSRAYRRILEVLREIHALPPATRAHRSAR